MFGLTSTKKYVALQQELKGYYDQQNELNELFRALSAQLKGTELPRFEPLSRQAIKDAFETCAPLYGIVTRIAENVGEVGQYLELINLKTGDVVEETDAAMGEIIRLIRRPNDRMPRAKYMEGWAINRLLFGDAWQYVNEELGKDYGNRLYLVPGQAVAIERGGVEQPVKGIKIVGGSNSQLIDIKDVITSFTYNLDPASFFGTSPVVAAARYLTSIERGMDRQNVAFQHGGAASLITPKSDGLGIKPSDAQELEQRVNGLKNTNKHLSMKIPVEVHQLGNTPVDLNILNSHKEAVTALCFAYNMPVDLYYGQSKYENAKEAKKALYEQNAIPLAEEFANDVLYHFDQTEGYAFKVNTDMVDVLQDNPYDAMIRMNQTGAFTTNEIRETAGWDRIEEPWADEVRMPLGVQLGNETYDIDESL